MAKRTVVRDPREIRQNKLKPVPRVAEEEQQSSVPAHQDQQTPLPIQPPHGQQPPSMGATLGFYAVAGVGVTLGFAIVGAILG